MKMVFGKWVKVEGAEAEGPGVFELDEDLVGLSEAKWKVWTGPTAVKQLAAALKDVDGVSAVTDGTEHVYFTYGGDAEKDLGKIPGIVGAHMKRGPHRYQGAKPIGEARANLQVDSGGGFSMEPRTNPTKTGPAAERAATLKTARMGIERMIQALSTVRGWIKGLGLSAEQDKSGAAAAALKMAADEIGKVEDVQGILASIFEMEALDARAVSRIVEEVSDFIVEKRNEPSPEAAKAMEGLTRMVDGLRQLQGMLRQAKLSGRILGAVDAAIAGLKATREALGAMSECVAMNMASDAANYPPPGTKFERAKATDIRKGSWVKGGTAYEPIYRQVAKIERQEDDMAFVILHFEEPYVGSDGQRRTTARFLKDAVVTSAKG